MKECFPNPRIYPRTGNKQTYLLFKKTFRTQMEKLPLHSSADMTLHSNK